MLQTNFQTLTHFKTVNSIHAVQPVLETGQANVTLCTLFYCTLNIVLDSIVSTHVKQQAKLNFVVRTI